MIPPRPDRRRGTRAVKVPRPACGPCQAMAGDLTAGAGEADRRRGHTYGTVVNTERAGVAVLCADATAMARGLVTPPEGIKNEAVGG